MPLEAPTHPGRARASGEGFDETKELRVPREGDGLPACSAATPGARDSDSALGMGPEGAAVDTPHLARVTGRSQAAWESQGL